MVGGSALDNWGKPVKKNKNLKHFGICAVLNPSEDHWLGLRKVFALTKNQSKKWILRVDLWDHKGGTAFAEYENFRLGNEKTAFKLHIGKYSGDAGTQIFCLPSDKRCLNLLTSSLFVIIVQDLMKHLTFEVQFHMDPTN